MSPFSATSAPPPGSPPKTLRQTYKFRVPFAPVLIGSVVVPGAQVGLPAKPRALEAVAEPQQDPRGWHRAEAACG